MIVRDTPGPLDLIFALRGSIVPRIALRIVTLMLVAAALVWVEHNRLLLPEPGGLGFTVFGIALSLFLGFRNNAAYDRWWEARKLWGGLLADVRTLAREAEIFVADQALRRALLRTALAFLHAHRANLRGLADDATTRQLGGSLADAPHPPDAALDALAAQIAAAARTGAIDGFGARALSERLGSMALQQAGCERIVGTPLPYVYSLLIYRTTWLFCLLLPLAVVEFFGHVPLVAAGLDSLPVNLGLKIALSYLLFQVACDVVMHFAHGPVNRFLEKMAPATVAEEISEPQYLYIDAERDPSSAVILTAREQERLLHFLPYYLDSVREDPPAAPKARDMLHHGSTQVAEHCLHFLGALLSVQMSEETLEIAVSLKDRNQLLSGLQETVYEFATAVERVRQIADPDSESRALAGNLVETLHLMLETLAEAAGQGEAELVMTLKVLTGDRSDLMHDIRRRLLLGGSMDSAVREAVFDALSLFERSLWLMRHFAMHLDLRNARSPQ